MKRMALSYFICFFFLFCREIFATNPQEAKRVISLAPSITEIIYIIEAGSNLVGRTSACDYPPEVLKVPIIGAFGKPSIEKVISLKPDIVLFVDLEDKSLKEYMVKLGIRMCHIQCKTLSDIPDAIVEIGKILNKEEKAKAVALNFVTELKKIKLETSTIKNRPKVYVEIWNDPLTTVGKNSFVNEIINIAGGSNIAGNIENDYFQVSPEWVIRENPEIILCLYMSKKPNKDFILERGKSWQLIKAVVEDKVFSNFDNSTILRPGPRVLRGILCLKTIFHPESTKE